MYNYSSSSVIQKFQKNAKHQMLHSVLTSIEAAAAQCLIFPILPPYDNGKQTCQLSHILFKFSPNRPPISQSRFNPKGAPREDLGAVLKPNIEPKLDEYHWYFF